MGDLSLARLEIPNCEVRPSSNIRLLKDYMCDGVNQLPVMVDGQIQGMLSRDDVVGYLHTLRELGV